MSSVNKIDKIDKILNKFKEKSLNVSRKSEKKEPITGSKKNRQKSASKILDSAITVKKTDGRPGPVGCPPSIPHDPSTKGDSHRLMGNVPFFHQNTDSLIYIFNVFTLKK